MRIILIGSGNVATVLGRKLLVAGHSIAQVYSRESIHAGRLAEELGAAAVSNPAQIISDGDIYILAIADDELYKAKGWMEPSDNLVVHTAGSVSMEILKDISDNYGVLYPLQSLRKEDVVNEIPFLIDGSTGYNKEIIVELAQSISENVRFADDDARFKWHLAAVIANNFSNHLYALTEQYCQKEGVDFSVLYPLIREGALRLERHSPFQIQTGPAIRGDDRTIQKHLDLLKRHPELFKMYELFTHSIISSKKRILP